MKNKETITWESLRAEWVNGNKSHVKNELDYLCTDKLLILIREAITNAYDSIDWDTESISGDLIDLIEILNFTLKGKI